MSSVATEVEQLQQIAERAVAEGRELGAPGLREFGIWDLKPEELDAYFVEFLDHLRECRYLPCTHTHEPDCAVIAAVERGEIDEGR